VGGRSVTILDDILVHKRVEVGAARGHVSPDEMRRRAEAAAPTLGFRSRLQAAPAPVVIAEIKRRSPSKGLIRPDFDPVELARAYVCGGAAALSVLTDEHFFGGHLDFLRQIRAAVRLPLLRKDFVVDTYQIDEARAAGADAVLLIVTALAQDELASLHAHAVALGLDVLVEVHDESELERALDMGATLVGVNNRDLRTFEVDLGVTERLARRLPAADDVFLVAESGIFGPADIARLERAGARAHLVGESLMRQPDVAKALGELRRAT
jgi:indole-3-glycerol phosphate synthase